MSLSEPPLQDPAEEPSDGPPYFADEMHALNTGFLTGALLKAGFLVILDVDDEGNYTGLMEIVISGEEVDEPIHVTVKVLP